MRLDVSNLANAARQVLGNRTFTRYTAVVTVLFSAFSFLPIEPLKAFGAVNIEFYRCFSSAATSISQ